MSGWKKRSIKVSMVRKDICKHLIDWIMFPQIYGYLKPHNMTLPWNGTFAKCNHLRLGHIGLWWALNPKTGVLDEKGRKRKRPFNNRSRSWSKYSQGTPRIAKNRQKLGQGMEQILPEPPKGSNSANTLTSDL